MMPKQKGSHPWALILCNASDQAAPTWPTTEYFTSLIADRDGGGLYSWWYQVSGALLDLEGSVVLGWFRLSNSVAEIAAMGRDQLVAAARAAATANGADLSGYAHTLAIVTGYPNSGNVDSDVAWGISATNGQPGWRWCSKCEGLAYWDGSRAPSSCAAGGNHDHSQSSYYSLPHDVTYPEGQDGWRWCSKCATLNLGGATPAPCPAGGSHELGSSFDYVVHRGPAARDEQQGWRWCSQCQALAFWDGSRAPGTCLVSATGRHVHASSGDYAVPQAWAACLGFIAHESGHGFGLDHAFGTSRSGDINNDARPGAYGDWTDIMSWDETAKFAVPLFTPAGAGLSGPTLNKLGWLGSTDLVRVTAPAAAADYPLRPLLSNGSSQARIICLVHPSQGWTYTAEYRTPQGWDQGVGSGRVVIHAMRSLYQAGQDGWRYCSSCEGLVFAGQTICPAGGVHDGGNSEDYWVRMNAEPGTGQDNWRWCAKCCGLFYAGHPSSACPAGGSHDGSQSADYSLPSSGDGQSNWRWCSKCQGLAFAGNARSGTCPAGGLHDQSGSTNYVLSTAATTGSQHGWRWCGKCQGLYYGGLGKCAGASVHTFVGDDFGLAANIFGAAGQSSWYYCNKCYGLAFYDAGRPQGTCAAGGTHNRRASANYVIPQDAENQASQRHWSCCQKCSALNFFDGSSAPGPCPAGGRHNSASEYFIAHDTAAVPGVSGFHWCRKCAAMVLGDNPLSCSGGGHHDTASSFNYVVRSDPSSLVREQSFWRTCNKCNVLFFLNSADGSNERPCDAGGTHSPTGEYFLTFVTNAAYWRWCSKCALMAYWDGSRPPGLCPAGGTHDHSSSASYIPPSFGLDVTQVVHDNLLVGQSWTDAANRVRFEVTAMDPASAVVRVSAT